MSVIPDEKILCLYKSRRGGAGLLRDQQMMVKSRADLLAEGLMALHKEGRPIDQRRPVPSGSTSSATDDSLWLKVVKKLGETKYPQLRTWEATPEGQEAFLAEAEELGLADDAVGLLEELA